MRPDGRPGAAHSNANDHVGTAPDGDYSGATGVTPARPPLPPIGAQVSTAGGLPRAVERAEAIGAEVIQIFPSNPRRWRPTVVTPEEIQDFRRLLDRAGLPLYVHTIYLINLASPDVELRRRSADALADALWFGALAGSAGVVTHIGSHRGDGFEAATGRVREGLIAARTVALGAVDEAENEHVGGPLLLPPLLLESSAGGGDSVGRDCHELSVLLETLADVEGALGVCLDTAHLFAAGFAVHTRAGLEGVLDVLRRRGHLEKVGLVHLNDCRSDLGSRSDRHENLGDGRLGLDGLAVAVRHPDLRSVPFVLEVPGIDGGGPDRENMRRAVGLRAGGRRRAVRGSLRQKQQPPI